MMRRVLAILGSALFLVIAPGIGAGLVPWWISRWRVQAPVFGFPPIRVLGVILIVLGIPVVLDSFARFALQGLGTSVGASSKSMERKLWQKLVGYRLASSLCSVFVRQGSCE